MNLISNDIEVSPIEYVTKYSINRNFLKLVNNDYELKRSIDLKISRDKVHSYILQKTYMQGDCVFYKTDINSMSLYLLCSMIDNNSNHPSEYVNSIGDLAVSSDEYWKIVGIPDDISANPRDYAIEYVLSNTYDFLSAHLHNEDLSAHPTRELGINDSTILFTSFENIESDRNTFFYPNLLATLTPDNTIIAGYMRKWDNGTLEYDVIFRVGYDGEITDQGLQVISANNLAVLHRNYNNLYFKDYADFKIFNLKDDYLITVNGTKQVNLNTKLNAYYGEVKFPEPFKDLNYMVFTSNEKNIDTESRNLKNDILKKQYDERLIIDGLALLGYNVSAEWEKELYIPSAILNICKEALSYIKETNEKEVIITMLSSHALVNIGDYAFESSEFKHVLIPKNVKCIGEGAFSNCSKLEIIDFYVNRDKTKLPVLDFNIFNRCDALYEIKLHYYTDPILMMANYTSEQRTKMYSDIVDVYDKLMDEDLRTLYGIGNSVAITRDGTIPEDSLKAMMKSHRKSYLDEKSVNSQTSCQYEEMTVDDFIRLVKSKNEKSLRFSLSKKSNLIVDCSLSINLTCSFGNVDTLLILGNDSMDCNISANVVDLLIIEGFAKISLSNINILSANKCYIDPAIEGTFFENSSIALLNANYLEIDMTNSFIEASAFVGSNIDTLVLKNYDLALTKPIVNRKGFGLNAFAGCLILNLSIESLMKRVEFKASMLKMYATNDDKNVSMLPDNCLINDYLLMAYDGELIAEPTSEYLHIQQEGGLYTVVSCNWLKIDDDFKFVYEDELSGGKYITSNVQIDVPSNVLRISPSAFNIGIDEYEATKGVLATITPISSINIPNTIQLIDDYAFVKCISLAYISGENGNVNLNRIGNKIFLSCNSLVSFEIL